MERQLVLSLFSKVQFRLALAAMGFALIAGCSAPRIAELVPTGTPTKTPRIEPTQAPPTPTVLPTSAPTATPAPSPTPEPPTPTTAPTVAATETLAPTAVPTAVPQSTASLERTAAVIAERLNIRSVPSTNGAILGQAQAGDTLKLLGRTSANDWMQICCAPGNQTGWVFAELIKLDGSVADLPVQADAIAVNVQAPSAPVVQSKALVRNPQYPISLRIPAIGIRAPVEWVGTTPAGAMDVPKDWDSVGWWQPGTVPGQAGSAVMAGHYDRDKPGPNGSVAAVFWNLARLNVGDVVFVTGQNGEELKFIVTGKESYPFNNAPLARIFGSNGVNAQLNLITCGGTWNAQTSNYSNRWVVYTRLAT